MPSEIWEALIDWLFQCGCQKQRRNGMKTVLSKLKDMNIKQTEASVHSLQATQPMAPDGTFPNTGSSATL